MTIRGLLASVAITGAFLLFMAGVSRAHGPAQWVQDGNYKNSVGELCCGQRDCGFFKAGRIEHVDGGYEVDAVFQVEFGGQIQLIHFKGFVSEDRASPSPTGEYWACMWGGELKCFFAPPPGS